ncbi:hypothetical protein [Thauera propionica]|uniref:hypothetical protein n=1 Tax=Thauera propionica TaxID=2019431 RepID=UPI0023F0A10C|nr:hypothetical protein [Thauera propionica]MDD3675243.1 hypothetical protein [Thauera propionica]
MRCARKGAGSGLQQREDGVQAVAAGVVDQCCLLCLCGFQGKACGAAVGANGVHDPHAGDAALGRLLALVVALVRFGRDAARQQAGVGFDRESMRVRRMHAGHGQTRGQQARRAFQEHQPHRRIHQLQRAVRVRRQIGDAMGVALAHRACFAIGIQRGTEGRFSHAGAVSDQLGPCRWPAQVNDRLTRQAEGKVEGAEPGAGAGEHRLEGGPVSQLLELLEDDGVALESAKCHGDGLGRTGRGGEIDADQRQRKRHRFRRGRAADGLRSSRY